MTDIKKTAKSKGATKTKKLTLSKDTIKDLTVGDKSDKVRGGSPRETDWISCSCQGPC